MHGKFILGALSLAIVLLADGVSSHELNNKKLSIKEVQENLEDFVREGFSQNKRKAPPHDLATFSYNHHGRRIPQKELKSRSCVAEGNRRTRELILNSLEIPEGMSAKEALKELTYDVCDIVHRYCGAESRSRTPEVRNIYRDHEFEFRTYDGSFNNENNYGVAGSVFQRIIYPADYEDAETCTLIDRGNPREISNAVSYKLTKGFAPVTVLLMQWGQFIDHDTTLFMELTEFDECCNGTNHECADIEVSPNDPIFHGKVTCLPFAKSQSTESECGPKVGKCEDRINFATAFFDGSQVYGTSLYDIAELREGSTHLLRTSADSEVPGCDSICDCAGIESFFLRFLPTRHEDDIDFFTGDPRVNEQPGLTSMHTVFMRYHNLIADAIKSNSDYSDDIVFELARQYVIATMQRISYLEFLPRIMGPDRLAQFFLNEVPYVYDPTIETGIFQEFSTAAFRMGHTLIPDSFDHIPLKLNFDRSQILRRAESSPSIILKAESSFKAEAFDTCFVDAIRNFLFIKEGEYFGTDLMVRNIQRCRDHGLSDFNTYRRWLGLSAVNRRNLKEIMRNGADELIRNSYNDFEDMDLFAVGLAEEPTVEGDTLGPVFTKIMALQFYALKYGDRFWYENIYYGAELEAINGTTLADILCEVTCIDEIQPLALKPISLGNEPESCLDRRLFRSRKTVLGYLRGKRWY